MHCSGRVYRGLLCRNGMACSPAPNPPSCPPWIITRSACGDLAWRSCLAILLGDLGDFARDGLLLGTRAPIHARDVNLAGPGEFHAKTPSRKEVICPILWFFARNQYISSV